MKLPLSVLTSVFVASSAMAVEFPVARLAPADVTRWVTVPGEVKPLQQVTLYAKVAGYLQSVNADLGDDVKAGDVLAEIEVPELLADRAKAKAELDLAQLEFNRTSDAVKKAPDLVVAQTLDAAKGKLDVAKANAERIETMLGFAKVKAPFAGSVTRRYLDKGAFAPAATSGSAAAQAALFTIVDATKVRVQAALPEGESALVKKGLPVKFSVEALPTKTFEGTVTRYSAALEAGTKTLLAEAEMENTMGELRPGMYATVKVGLDTHKGVNAMPIEALVMEKQTAVAFLFKDGKARRVVLEIGFNDGKNVEVIKGIGPDDQVLKVGTATVTDGQTISVKEAK